MTIQPINSPIPLLPEEYDYTPLQLACSQGNRELVLALLDKGADINGLHMGRPPYGFHMGRSPLQIARRHKQEDICLDLIERGADLSGIHHFTDFSSKLMIAFLKRQPPKSLTMIFQDCSDDIIIDLIKAKAFDINLKDYSSETPLSLACEMGRDKIIQALIEAGADPSIGSYPIDHLIRAKNLPLIDLLVSSGPVLMKDVFGWTPLHKFCHDLDSNPLVLNLMEKVIKKGIPVDAVTNSGQTALQLANSLPKLELLLKIGANVNHESQLKETALFRDNITLDEAKFLVSQGANVHQKRSGGGTLLFNYRTNIDLFNFFINQGVDVNAQNDEGRTALFKGDGDRIKFLIEKGANPEIRDNKGNTALLHITSQPYPSFDDALELVRCGAKVGVRNGDKTPLNCALGKKEGKEFVQYALKDYPALVDFIEKMGVENLYSHLLGHPELLLAMPHPLEIPFLLFDTLLAHRVLTQLSLQKFDEELQFIQSMYNPSSLEWLHESTLTISPDHYTLEPSCLIEIPKMAPEEMPLNKATAALLEMFDATPFKDPYKLVDDGSPVTVERLRENLQSLINHLEKRDAFLAVPTEDVERNSYYDKLEKLIRWTLLNLSQFPEKDKDVKGGILYHLAVACGHCGTRYLDGALEAFLDSSIQRSDKVEDLGLKLIQILQAFREISFYLMLQKQYGDQNIHSHNFYLSLIGKARAIPHADTSYNDPVWDEPTSLDEGLQKFDAIYSPSAMINRVEEAIHGREIPFLNFLQIWLKENPSKSWKPTAEMIEELEDNLGLSLEDIENNPKDRGDAYAYAMTNMSEKPVRLKKEEERRVARDLLMHHGHLKRLF